MQQNADFELRHTRVPAHRTSLDLCVQVRIVGNQRTRAGVVGQVGIVKRAVGLGERVCKLSCTKLSALCYNTLRG